MSKAILDDPSKRIEKCFEIKEHSEFPENVNVNMLVIQGALFMQLLILYSYSNSFHGFALYQSLNQKNEKFRNKSLTFR